jgi:hypothetical protein
VEAAGIEETKTGFANNRISNTGICGIGGWYWNSLSASTISGNTVAERIPEVNILLDEPAVRTFVRERPGAEWVAHQRETEPSA